MIHSRLRPILGAFALLCVLLLVRLFQVQVLEHAVWAGEASRLVHMGRDKPYRRGRILDAGGRVLARDEELRTVMLVYREFRRGHPLGQVAHARSLLERRPVSLAEARANLSRWALELVRLRPADLRAYAHGSGAARDSLDEYQRTKRGNDLSFYVLRLLELDPEKKREEWKAFSDAANRAENEQRSFVELTSAVRNGGTPDAEREERALQERLARSLHRLEVLARWLDPARPTDAPSAEDASASLIAELERARRATEDATAAKLFAEATGFAPGRLEEETLLECFDHDWIVGLLGWDHARLCDWAATVRAGWQKTWLDTECLPRLCWQFLHDPEHAPSANRFLDYLAVAYEPEAELREAFDGKPLSWREVDDPAVFAELSGALQAEIPEEAARLAREALPFQLAGPRSEADVRSLLPPGNGPDSFQARLERALASRGRAAEETLLALARELLERWELRFQETLRRALDATRLAADPAELGRGGALLLSEGSRERAAERAEYFLKDYGMRPRPIAAGEPTYDVIYLLTRYEADFSGFEVRELSTRERVELEGDDQRPADLLLGRVSAPTLEDELRQHRAEERLRTLKARPDRDEEETEELQRLIGEVHGPREAKGVSGLEAFFEPELTGTNGYAETRGLTEVFGAGGDEIPVLDPIDGQDVELTLDTGLQAAAQRSLRAPFVADDEKFDYEWQRDPVGAIVLLDREGNVLAAASEPDDQSLVDPEAPAERRTPAERTLQKRTFQPPGSVFKVFVAAWALDHGLDPHRTVTCAPIERGGAGYKDLRCWNTQGHGTVDLRAALEQSCNAYFAWLGETLHTQEFEELCADFGFGQPTGVRRAPPWDDGTVRRSGLREDRAGLAPGHRELADALRRMAANGLGVVEVTPMQLARATLALGTGELRELSLVRRVGARDMPPGANVPLPISEASLDFVRHAMRGVADAPLGTAHAALRPSELGFTVAVKTGSADLENRTDREGRNIVAKHAWVAGWVPADKPRLVFVVFEDRTHATSSHGAIYLARQVLQQPEVLRYLADAGVDVTGVPAR